MANTLVKRVGGKIKLRNWIKSKLPAHNIYCEPFGGSFAVGLGLPRANEKDYRLVYNDLDCHIYNFFKVLREQKQEFINLLELTPYSRKDFELSYEIFGSDKWKEISDLERARLYLIKNRQSFAGKEDGTWSISRQGENIAQTWKGLPKLVVETAEHLKNAFIECSDYRDIFQRWDSPETCFYIDPPYEDVEADYYDVNKKDGFDHKALAEAVCNLKGSAAVSYYYSDTIVSLYPGFEVETIDVVKHMQTKEVKDKAVEMLLIKKSDWAKEQEGGLF